MNGWNKRKLSLGQKKAWGKLTPQERAERVRKIQEGRHKAKLARASRVSKLSAPVASRQQIVGAYDGKVPLILINIYQK